MGDKFLPDSSKKQTPVENRTEDIDAEIISGMKGISLLGDDSKPAVGK